MHPAYIGGATAGYVLFDMSKFETLEESDKWINLIRKYNSPSTPVILVGTKFDLVKSQEQLNAVCTLANKIVAEHDLTAFVVTSSKLNYNVDETIGYMIDYLLWKKGSC